jgi:hypothetical protein
MQEETMDVRNMNGDPGIWEGLSWEDMSSREQELWSEIGWRKDTWNRNEAPASVDKEWSGLNDRERKAAAGLGFTEEMWNGFEDQ